MPRTNERHWPPVFLLFVFLLTIVLGCGFMGCGDDDALGNDELGGAECGLVEEGFGPDGEVAIRTEEVVSGLTVPWGIGFLPDGGLLVSERPGRVRLVRDGALVPDPVLTLDVGEDGEGGLLGLALHPNFGANRQFYLYYTADTAGGTVNRVERFILSPDGTSATSDRVILDNIPAGVFHNGGRIRFGPDGLLYIGTGDARDSALAQDPASLAGKILRVNPDGGIPGDNPFDGSPVYILGVRNTQGFDWLNDATLLVTDHGPTGELGRSGGDEVSVAGAGDNLGWPTVWKCGSEPGLTTPILTWDAAVPPGGAALYTGEAIPEFQGDLLITTLGSEHLHRVDVSAEDGAVDVTSHEVYLRGDLGRLREAVMGPDGQLYVTTSNCDGRGACPADRDKIVRITR